jgi:hyaluronoglucosaminidase
MMNIGIVEGFFGSPWSFQARVDWAKFLKKYGGDFYLYAPKRDHHLRKAWREIWDDEYLHELKSIRDEFHQQGLKFGVALSPFGLGSSISGEDFSHLKNRFLELANLQIDYLGLFFDDMPSTDKLLEVQSEVVNLALKFFPHGLIFCPSYYSEDPILDKVFGTRPEGYMEGLKDSIAYRVDICWTGPKVISEEISSEHLDKVHQLLGRPPFIWENLYANDGPRNCKFLKLRYFEGRDEGYESRANGVAFNLMNQPYLSQLLYLSSLWVLKNRLDPQKAFESAAFELYPASFAQHLIQNRELYLNQGLEGIQESQKEELKSELKNFSHPAALEVLSWLEGHYLVGPECLTD